MAYIPEPSIIARLRNWETVKAMGKIYTRVYIVFAMIAIAIFIIGVILSVVAIFVSIFDQKSKIGAGQILAIFLGVSFIGCLFGLITCGPMTIIAKIVESAKQMKSDWDGN